MNSKTTDEVECYRAVFVRFGAVEFFFVCVLTERGQDKKAVVLILDDRVLDHRREHRKRKGGVLVLPEFKAIVGLAVIGDARGRIDDAIDDEDDAAEVHGDPGERTGPIS